MLPDTSSANKLPETQVVIDERGRVLLNRTPPDRLFHGASAVQARTYAALVPALAHEFDVVLPRGLLWFEIGQLQLFPQPVENVFDFELEHELKIALTAAGLVATLILALLRLSRAQYLSRFARTLARARFALRIAQSETSMLRKTHWNEHSAAARPAQNIWAGDQVRERLLDGFAHLLVVPQPIACAARKEIVPPYLGRYTYRRLPTGHAVAVETHSWLPRTSRGVSTGSGIVGCSYSWASSVVT
jgi:hypothetical protein